MLRGNIDYKHNIAPGTKQELFNRFLTQLKLLIYSPRLLKDQLKAFLLEFFFYSILKILFNCN